MRTLARCAFLWMWAFASAGVSTADEVSTGVAPTESLTGRQLVQMFSAGFGRGPSALKDAQRSYDLARDTSKGDPKVDYGFGLVLLKQLRTKEAIAQFQSATKSSGSEAWPAWRALIWSHFVAKDYTAGYERLNQFAKLLASDKAPTDLYNRQYSAEWMGEVIAALQKSADTVKQRATLLHAEEAIKEYLGPDLQSSFASGKSSVHALHSLMEDDVQQTREIVQSKQEKARADKQAQVGKELEASAEKRESLKKTTEDWKKYLDEQLAAFDKQLARLERDYDFMQRRVLSISASQLQLNTEMGLISQQATNSANSNTGTGTGNQNSQTALSQAYAQRQTVLGNQLLSYQLQLDQTLAGMMVVSQRAQAVVSQRATVVQQYERATGQLVEQNAELSKWEDRLKTDTEKLKKPASGKSKVVDSKVQQARSFRTYVDLDLNLERDQLLDYFGVAIPEAADSAK